ncbi:MAG: hypothetical protein D3915_10675 [Candidatus Electrothrix sp. AU1_5]|nr:hypothetical protein [Candidatus Electrothrix gigas]
MKISILVFSVILLSISVTASAQDLWGEYTLTRNCGADAVYVGPNKAEEHGGVCLHYKKGVFEMHTSYTMDKNCAPDGVYVGPNRPDLHGGYCLWLKGKKMRTSYTTNKACGTGVYAGPNKASEHGGYCVYIVN